MKSGYNVILLLFSTLFLWACGGGGDIKEDGIGPDGGGGNTDTTLSITIESSSSSVSLAAPVTLTATVIDSENKVQPNKVVTFSLSDENMGTFSVANQKVATNSEGVATIQLATGSIAGATTVTATLDEDDSVSANTVVTMTGDGGDVSAGAQILVSLHDDDGNEVNAITSTQPAIVTATITGLNQVRIVTFESTIGELPIATAVTDDQGRASVQIFAGSVLGAGKVKASIESGEEGEAVVVVGATNLVMGSGSPFVPERANVSLVQLSAGGTATVSVQIQDENGNPYTQPIDVNFSSRCFSSATPQAEISTPVATVNGVATTTYLAQGCVGDDPINVTARTGGLNLTASGTINVLPADVGSIVFVSAEPEMLTLKGTGSQETSTVKFRVLDENGNPVNNQEVNFELNTNAGGLSLNPTSASTNNEGVVQTVVNTGTVSTSVRVTAKITTSNSEIVGQSSQLVVSTGIPDQDSFSIAASSFNVEGWDKNGTQVTITARLADAFNNPAPDGTDVYFTTEGGYIEPSCQTDNGECEVTWTSSNPKPVGSVFDSRGILVEPVIVEGIRNPVDGISEDNDAYFGGNHYKGQYGGRVTITATAIGEESFNDINNNGWLDTEAEAQRFLNGTDVSGEPYDLDDPFQDYNEDGLFNPQQDHPSGIAERVGGEAEELISFPFGPTGTHDGVFDFADRKYNGVLCKPELVNVCADGVNEPQSTYLRRNLVLVMSGSNAYVTPKSQMVIRDALAGNEAIDIVGKSTGSVTFTVSDIHNQPMPAGTLIKFSTSAGSVASAPVIEWPDTNENRGLEITATVKGTDESESGVLSVSVELPSGAESELFTIDVNIF